MVMVLRDWQFHLKPDIIKSEEKNCEKEKSECRCVNSGANIVKEEAGMKTHSGEKLGGREG